MPQSSWRVELDADTTEKRRLFCAPADTPLTLAPLLIVSNVVEKRNITGGSGANFIVEWSAEEAGNRPVLKAVMMGVDNT